MFFLGVEPRLQKIRQAPEPFDLPNRCGDVADVPLVEQCSRREYLLWVHYLNSNHLVLRTIDVLVLALGWAQTTNGKALKPGGYIWRMSIGNKQGRKNLWVIRKVKSRILLIKKSGLPGVKVPQKQFWVSILNI